MTGAGDSTAKLWDLNNDDGSQKIWTFVGHTQMINSVAITPDGYYLMIESEAFTSKLWHLQIGAMLHTFGIYPKGAFGPAKSSHAISLDGHFLVRVKNHFEPLDHFEPLNCRLFHNLVKKGRWPT